MTKPRGVNENRIRATAHRLGLDLRPMGRSRFVLQAFNGRGRAAGGRNGWTLVEIADWLARPPDAERRPAGDHQAAQGDQAGSEIDSQGRAS